MHDARRRLRVHCIFDVWFGTLDLESVVRDQLLPPKGAPLSQQANMNQEPEEEANTHNLPHPCLPLSKQQIPKHVHVAYAYEQISTSMYTYTHAYVFSVHIHICIHTSRYVYAYRYMRVCLFIHTYMYTYRYLHTYIYILCMYISTYVSTRLTWVWVCRAPRHRSAGALASVASGQWKPSSKGFGRDPQSHYMYTYIFQYKNMYIYIVICTSCIVLVCIMVFHIVLYGVCIRLYYVTGIKL